MSALPPFVVTPGEGQALWHMGSLLEVKATGRDTDGQFWLAEQSATQGYASPVHRHSREDELFTILDGELAIRVGEEEYSAPAGTIAFAPRGLPHAFQIKSPSARFLILTSPAGFEDWFFETGQPAGERVIPAMPSEPPDVGRLIASLQSYGVDLIAPPAGMPLRNGQAAG
jgi:quercetin dioxygenase-like cupin family protein